MLKIIKGFVGKKFPYVFALLRFIRYSWHKRHEAIMAKDEVAKWLSRLATYTVYAKAKKKYEEPPIVILSCYNDIDIIEGIIEEILLTDCQLIIVDNWSNDGTWDKIVNFKSHINVLHIEQFPLEGPSNDYNWKQILDRKSLLAADYPNRWILHQDSDEITLSPLTNFSLSEVLSGVSSLGFNVVSLRMLDFRAIKDDFIFGNPVNHFKFFLFSDIPSYQLQNKIWLQPDNQPVNLSELGGHDVNFTNKKVFPLRFPRLHYSIRSFEQINRKYLDRLKRTEKERKLYGWHIHLDKMLEEKIVFQQSELNEFNRNTLYVEHKKRFYYAD